MSDTTPSENTRCDPFVSLLERDLEALHDCIPLAPECVLAPRIKPAIKREVAKQGLDNAEPSHPQDADGARNGQS